MFGTAICAVAELMAATRCHRKFSCPFTNPVLVQIALMVLNGLQIYLKGTAKRHSDAVPEERHGILKKKPKQVPDFLMQGNSNVSYGKFIHQVSFTT